jgi:hypothetical protein
MFVVTFQYVKGVTYKNYYLGYAIFMFLFKY